MLTQYECALQHMKDFPDNRRYVRSGVYHIQVEKHCFWDEAAREAILMIKEGLVACMDRVKNRGLRGDDQQYQQYQELLEFLNAKGFEAYFSSLCSW